MEDDQETDVNASLVEESSATPACAEPSGLVDAVRRLATDASAFFSQVAAWRRIPAVVARIVVSDDDALLPTDGVRRWIAAELRRLQTEADDGDLVDEELVDYTLGLLEHPEFAHPDLVVLELQEFLGREAATSFVLSLWRFLVMEIGLRHVHKTAAPPSTTSAAPPAASSLQMARRSTANSSAASTPPPLQSQAPDYKRRRPSYRRKGSSHHNPYHTLREVLAAQMHELSVDTGRELAAEPHAVDAPQLTTNVSTANACYRWQEMTDALASDRGDEVAVEVVGEMDASGAEAEAAVEADSAATTAIAAPSGDPCSAPEVATQLKFDLPAQCLHAFTPQHAQEDLEKKECRNDSLVAAPCQATTTTTTTTDSQPSARACAAPSLLAGPPRWAPLLFGGGDSDGNNGASYLDERKTRRFKAQEMPEHTNPIVDKNSFYGSETAAQRERDRVTLPPGAVPRDALVVAAPNAYGRRGSNPGPSSSMSEYFSNGMGGEADNQARRSTRRMFGPSGGASTFKLG
ncbi:hypothetical protein PINS_up021519 [Pythium insidiosum]|nr:hypothetical protein PINS_up021519 [Pythium insidiosum]